MIPFDVAINDSRNHFNPSDLTHQTPFAFIPIPGTTRDEICLQGICFQPGFAVVNGKEICEVTVELPGVKKEDAKVNLCGRDLTISAKRYKNETAPTESTEDDNDNEGHDDVNKRLDKLFLLAIYFEDGEPDGFRMMAKLANGILSIKFPSFADKSMNIEIS